jgi:hypothetical protein
VTHLAHCLPTFTMGISLLPFFILPGFGEGWWRGIIGCQRTAVPPSCKSVLLLIISSTGHGWKEE